jgi:hypothetical protein
MFCCTSPSLSSFINAHWRLGGRSALLALIVISAMGLPRAKHMMAPFIGMDPAGVLSNHHSLYWMGFLRAPRVMARFAGANQARGFGAIVCFRHRFIACRTGALVAVAMGFPRAEYVMAHFPGRMIPSSQNFRGVAGYFGLLYFFCLREKAGVFLNHHPFRAGAVVRQFGNRFIFCRARVYLSTENERHIETSGHDYYASA